jgi:hypothetical protein
MLILILQGDQRIVCTNRVRIMSGALLPKIFPNHIIVLREQEREAVADLLGKFFCFRPEENMSNIPLHLGHLENVSQPSTQQLGLHTRLTLHLLAR